MTAKKVLTEHQSILMELWNVFDKICSENRIKYMLFAGSALGAVRNEGIIPWDDDLDVIMMRPEYDRFLQAAKKEIDSDEYYLQCEYTDHWPMFFSKLRKNGTACIERYIPKDPLTHQGIYIDIFPCDNLSDNLIKRKIQFLCSKIVISNSLNKRGYITNNVLKKVFMKVCSHLPQKSAIEFSQNRNDCDSKFVHTFFGGSKRYKKSIFPREWFEEVQLVPFEDRQAPVSIYSDDLLHRLYGDYMTPLPEEKRGCKVHGVIVDPNNSYEIYLDVQKKSRYNEYSKSIR